MRKWEAIISQSAWNKMPACKIAWQFMENLLFSWVYKFYCIDYLGNIHHVSYWFYSNLETNAYDTLLEITY